MQKQKKKMNAIFDEEESYGGKMSACLTRRERSVVALTNRR